MQVAESAISLYYLRLWAHTKAVFVQQGQKLSRHQWLIAKTF